jgi:D-alanyl-D-alanine dipeptidase
MNDPAVTSIVVVDVGEPLVDLEAAGLVVFSDRKRAKNPHLAFVRECVAGRIEHATRALPSGIRFLGVEAFRPAQLQHHYYDDYRDRLRAANPSLPEDDLDGLTARFVSPPDIAPHPSGAAIDLTLCGDNGEELDLGTPVDATPESSAGACFTAASNLTTTASKNRRLLINALQSAGLVNYPTEWWHWSYGDRYWAMNTGSSHAIYGPIHGIESSTHRQRDNRTPGSFRGR